MELNLLSQVYAEIYGKISNYHTKWTGESAKMKVILCVICQ